MGGMMPAPNTMGPYGQAPYPNQMNQGYQQGPYGSGPQGYQSPYQQSPYANQPPPYRQGGQGYQWLPNSYLSYLSIDSSFLFFIGVSLYLSYNLISMLESFF